MRPESLCLACLARHCHHAGRHERVQALTPREIHILAGLSGGRSLAAIAADAGISPAYIRARLHDTYRKFRLGGQDSLRQLSLWAYRHRAWLEPSNGHALGAIPDCGCFLCARIQHK